MKAVPGDGVLRLPGLRAGQLNEAYLLGSPSHQSFTVTSSKIAIGKDSLAGAGYLPVIVLPFAGKLKVTQVSSAAAAAGDHFFNYNGAGYEAPKTLYKLRWLPAAPPGRYRAEIDVQPTQAKAGMDLVVGGLRIPLNVPLSVAASVTIKQNIRVSPTSSEDGSPVNIELTPPEPCLKGTQLPCSVLAIRLVREK